MQPPMQTGTFTAMNKLPLNYFCLVGLTPFKLDANLSRSVWREAHTLFLAAGYVVVFCFAIGTANISDDIGGVTWFASMGIWLGINVSCIANMVEVYRKWREQRELLLVINRIDKHLMDVLNCRISYAELQRAKLTKYGLMGGLIGASFIISGLNIFFGRNVLRLVLLLIPCFMLYSRAFQLLFYLDAVADRAKLCCARLEKTSDAKGLISLSREELLSVKGFISLLFEANFCFNRTFGWSMVFIFLEHFVGIICNTYWLFVDLSGLNEGSNIFGTWFMPFYPAQN